MSLSDTIMIRFKSMESLLPYDWNVFDPFAMVEITNA